MKNLLRRVGDLLTDRREPMEVVAIGGGSLLLLGLIKRPTRDLDFGVDDDGSV